MYRPSQTPGLSVRRRCQDPEARRKRRRPMLACLFLVRFRAFDVSRDGIFNLRVA